MRIKATFTLFKRTIPSGRQVYYYQCYDEKGKRQFAKSTGRSLKTEANEYCLILFKNGLLIPEQKKPTFAEFSAGWWDYETCQYLKWRKLHEPITDSTLIIYQANFRNHIKDYFAKYKLDEITSAVIETWLVYMSEKGSMRIETKRHRKNKFAVSDNKEIAVKPKKLLKAKTINLALFTLKIMLGEAVKRKLLKVNPCLEVKELTEEESVRVILNADEFKRLFPVDWSTVWENETVYKANLLAACAGLRIGELRGLRGDMVFDTYIHVKGQYLGKSYVDHTKTKDDRSIPISPVMRKMLDDLLLKNDADYVFSDDGGKTPITNNMLNDGLTKALINIGISYEEKLKRNLSFHAWRHFLNTLLLTSNVGLSKVQKVTGHKTLKMTEHYTHFDTTQFTEVVAIQNNLLSFNKPETKLIQANIIQADEVQAEAVKSKRKKKA
jgi:integrase